MNSHARETAGSTENVQFVDCVRRSHPSGRRDLLLQFLREQLAGSLAVDPMRIGTRDNLMELGIDSIKAVEFKFLLESKLGLRISSSLVFDYPTLDALTGFLLEQISASQEQPLSPSSQPRSFVDRSENELARLVASELKELNSRSAE
jgi:acyl carrier protein